MSATAFPIASLAEGFGTRQLSGTDPAMEGPGYCQTYLRDGDPPSFQALLRLGDENRPDNNFGVYGHDSIFYFVYPQ